MLLPSHSVCFYSNSFYSNIIYPVYIIWLVFYVILFLFVSILASSPLITLYFSLACRIWFHENLIVLDSALSYTTLTFVVFYLFLFYLLSLRFTLFTPVHLISFRYCIVPFYIDFPLLSSPSTLSRDKISNTKFH